MKTEYRTGYYDVRLNRQPIEAIFEDGSTIDKFDCVKEAEIITGIDWLTILSSADDSIDLVTNRVARFNFRWI